MLILLLTLLNIQKVTKTMKTVCIDNIHSKVKQNQLRELKKNKFKNDYIRFICIIHIDENFSVFSRWF